MQSNALFASVLIFLTFPNTLVADDAVALPTNLSEISRFHLWISAPYEEPCAVSWKAIFERVQPVTRVIRRPTLEWWTDGQPSGPTVEIGIHTGQVLPSELCVAAISFKVLVNEESGWNVPNKEAVYLDLGAVLTSGSDRAGSSDSIEEAVSKQIQDLIIFFVKDVYKEEEPG